MVKTNTRRWTKLVNYILFNYLILSKRINGWALKHLLQGKIFYISQNHGLVCVFIRIHMWYFLQFLHFSHSLSLKSSRKHYREGKDFACYSSFHPSVYLFLTYVYKCTSSSCNTRFRAKLRFRSMFVLSSTVYMRGVQDETTKAGKGLESLPFVNSLFLLLFLAISILYCICYICL